MHVLHLTKWHPVIDGVAGSFIVQQCEALHKSGLQVGLVFCRVEGLSKVSRIGVAAGLPSIVSSSPGYDELGFKTWNVPILRRLWPNASDCAIKALCRSYQGQAGTPDVIHAHVALETGRVAREIAQSQSIPYVITEHSSEILNRDLRRSREEAAQAAYRDAHKVIAVSQALANRIHDICPEANLEVVPNLVPAWVFDEDLVSRSSGKFIVITISSLVPAKQVSMAIDSLAALPTEAQSQIEHWIVGDGPERERLAEIARSSSVCTKFFGNVDHRKAISLLRQAELMIHPSAFETFGLVLAEAMAVGCPVLATRCGGPEEFVTEKQGYLVNCADRAGMTEAVQNALKNRSVWDKKRHEIIDYARSKFHAKNISLKIMANYR